eukprot:TRINITY_DN65677_c3_g1_i1.p1 TRINITY_DN65677_c3_g1~~TRINITY_DN65677_c3_g1_i1.p1  ORF type:complete len:997 (+),score=196.90 TRINITY_DN65677_c3_g1_i1:78-3068(+)
MAGQDKLFEEIVQQSNNFEQYEKAFQEVLVELDGEEMMEPFRKEYETLHHSFMKAHDNEKRLIKKSQDLQAEIIACQSKVRTAQELSQGDQQTIESLRKEIGKAKNKLELSKEKEITQKEKIKGLRMEIRDLENQVKKGVSGLVGHDTTINDLQKVKDDLSKERDTQNTQLAAIKADIKDLRDKIDKLQAEKAVQDQELLNLKKVIEMKENELEEQKQRKENWEKELKVLKAELTKRNGDIQEKQGVIQASMQAILRLDEQLIDQKSQTEKAIKDYEQINKRTQKLQQDLEEEIQKHTQILAENQNLNVQLKTKDTEISQIRADTAKQVKIRDSVTKRNRQLEGSRKEVEEERNALRLEIQALETNIAAQQKHSENDKKQIDDLTRERDILNKNYLKAQGSTNKQADWVLIKENQKRNLEQEIHGFERHAQKQRELIYQLQKETEAYEKDAEEAAHKYQKALEAVKTQSQVVQENQKAIADSETKRKQQQNLFETVLNERNLYSKQLLELHSEINEMRRKFRIMNHNITQLKDEIQQKEKSLVDEHIQHQKLEKEKKEYKTKINRHKQTIEASDKKIGQLAQEINKLNQIINEADAEKSKQKRDYENVMNERDILGAQLIKRNDELAQLYERIRIQQSSLNKGELQYRDRLMDIRNLRSKIRQLGVELHNVKTYISRIGDLKRDINVHNKQLNQERAKVKALADELENPLNVHRWHKLEGSEPQTYEMIQNIHKLQKQLIQKTEEVQNKEGLIAEKEKLFLELKGILARQPGPEVAEQINVYKESLKKKTMQHKSMEASLAHFQNQVDEYKEEYSRLNSEMGDIKKTYFRKKRFDASQSNRGSQSPDGRGSPTDGMTDEQRRLHEEQMELQNMLAQQEQQRQQDEQSRQELLQQTQAVADEGAQFQQMQQQRQHDLSAMQQQVYKAADAADEVVEAGPEEGEVEDEADPPPVAVEEQPPPQEEEEQQEPVATDDGAAAPDEPETTDQAGEDPPPNV